MTTISVLLGPTLSTGRAGFSPAPCQLLLPGLSAAEVCSPQPDLPLHPLGSLRETCSKTHKDPSTSPLRWAAGLTLPQWLPFPLPNVQTRNYSLDFVLHSTTLDNSAYFYLVSSVYSAGKQTGDGITTNIPGAGIPVAQCSFYREAKKKLMQIILLEHFPIGIESLESLCNQSSSLFSTTHLCVCVCVASQVA